MSKEAAVRAMREARYNARSAGSPAASAPAKPAVRPAKVATAKAVGAAAPASPSDEMCGHRSMNGRSCTREPGHAAKSHRYS